MLQQRAQNLLQLWEQTKEDVANYQQLSGTVHVGCVESSVSPFLMGVIGDFLGQHPQVSLSMVDGDGDTLREDLDRGLLDMAALIEPVEATKYNSMVLPVQEEWGIIMRADDPLTNKHHLNRHDIEQLPLILTRRSIVRNDISQVLHMRKDKLNIRMTINLPGNANQLIRRGHYYALAIKGVYDNTHDSALSFVPLYPQHTTGHVMVWRKNSNLTQAALTFLHQVSATAKQH